MWDKDTLGGGFLQGGPLLVINGVQNRYKWPYKLVTGAVTLLIGG